MCFGSHSKNSEKMYFLLLSLLVLSCEVFSASIHRKDDTSEDNINLNLVGFENNFVKGLTPPAFGAVDYYNIPLQRSNVDNSYTVEISRNNLKIKVNGFPDQNVKLTEAETEGIQKLSLSIVQLLNSSKLASEAAGKEEEAIPDWNEVAPVVVLTNSGISLQFLTDSEPETQATETTSEDKKILWDFLSKYARNIFEAKLKELKINNKYAEAVDSTTDQSDSSPFDKFVNLLWRMMTFSVNYAETNFGGWTTSSPATSKFEEKIRPTVATLLAFEEPSPFHEFPSQEFQFRRKDVDSIFYGRGVI